ncbi:MAG: FliM/FliN family flagellar motor switch protein [Rhizobium sp.]|nr:FliM/FliN family flagellar motor switch protein [Rhizobium sp.]
MKELNTKAASAASAGSHASLSIKDIGLIGHVPVTLMAQVGSVPMTIEKLYAMKKGDVLSMVEALDAPVSLLLNGKVVARGELMAVDDQLGVRVIELA